MGKGKSQEDGCYGHDGEEEIIKWKTSDQRSM